MSTSLPLETRFAEWLVSYHTGMSSLAIAARMLAGHNVRSPYSSSYPRDIGDFYRCTLLLARIPEWRRRIGDMADVSATWARLAEHWDELERLYFASDAVRTAPGKTLRDFRDAQDVFSARLREVTDEVRP